MSKRLLAVLLFLGVTAIAAELTSTTSDPMATAANELLASLSEEQRDRCAYPFDDAERRHWQAAPMGDAGIRLDTLSEAQQAQVRALLKSVLSSDGLATVDGVRVLEGILVAMEKERGQVSRFHGPGRYFVTVYGDPSTQAAWGWRLEGHHLSMTFTCVNDRWTAHGPLFVGSQPAHVHGGKHDGTRLLGKKDDDVRTLFASLDAAQSAKATDQGDIPGNILLAPGEDQGFDEPGGIVASDLTSEQREALQKALFDWASWLRPDLAQREKQRMKRGLDQTRLLWRGGTGIDAPHYWRIVGPHFAIEYAAPERDPDHVHALWRDIENDFGGNLLKRHLELDHGDR